MNKVLVTGATGNIGQEVIHYLFERNESFEVIAGVRNIDKSKQTFSAYPELHYRTFDFENQSTFSEAFDGVSILFLLRPPQISDVEKYFRPLLQSAKKAGIKQVVFLSVQGAELSKVIPHNKIERPIKEFGFEYIFVRPSYFMQNLTTTLLPEITTNQSITLPSGHAKFNWVDVGNIGEATAVFISNFNNYKNSAFEITGNELKNFFEIVSLLSEILEVKFIYKSVNPIRFFFLKRKQGLSSDFALVMTMLHFLPRVQKQPAITNHYQELTGKSPTTLKEFIAKNRGKFISS